MSKTSLLGGAEILVGSAAFFVLFIIQSRNYLLFHALAEFYAIVIAFSVFVVAWTGRRYTGTSYLLFLGIAYL